MLRSFVSYRTASLLAVCFLAGLGAVFFAPLLFGNRVLFFGDLSLYFVPLLAFQRSEIVGHGRIPLWNPHLMCGTPFVGNPQTWPLYPSSLLLYALSPERMVGVTGALHILLASLGAYAFFLAQGRRISGALLGAVVWAYGGAVVSKLQFPNMVQAIAYLPWLLLAVEEVIRRPGSVRIALLAAVIGLSLLASHAQMTLQSGYLALAWAVFRMRGRTEKRTTLFALAGGSLLGGALAAGQILPVLELLRHTDRQGLSLVQASRFLLPPYAVLTNFVAPNYYGNPALPGSPYIGRGNFWEPCCYLGIAPLLLALLGTVRRFREAETRFWAIAAAVCVWLALGRLGGLYDAAFYLLPGIARFHDAARFLIPGTFALAALAAQGIETLALMVPQRWRLLAASIVLFGTLADLLPFSATLNPTMAQTHVTRILPSDGRIWHADESAVWGAFISYGSYEAIQQSPESFLGSLAPNLPERQGIDDACGYEPVALAGVAGLCARLKKAPSDDTLLDTLAVTTIVYWDRRSGQAILVSRGDRPLASRALLQGAKPLPLRIESETPDRVVIWLPPKHPAGLVRLADTAFPGWGATVDGIATPLQTFDGIFRGVYVGVNSSVVTFSYAPNSWHLGCFVSLIALGILSALFASAAVSVACRVFPCLREGARQRSSFSASFRRALANP